MTVSSKLGQAAHSSKLGKGIDLATGLLIPAGGGIGQLPMTFDRQEGVYTGIAARDLCRPINQSFPAVSSGAVSMTSHAAIDRLFTTPFFVGKPGVIYQLRNYKSGAGSFRWGIYGSVSEDVIFPGALLWDSGLTGGASGIKSFALALELAIGWYWFGGAISDFATSMFMLTQTAIVDLGVEANWNGVTSGSPSHRCGFYTDVVLANALPSTFPAGATAMFHASGHVPTAYAKWRAP